MKLAVRKEPGSVPGGGYHYMLHTMELSDFEATMFKKMGYIVLDVAQERGQELLTEARAALIHQINVAVLTDEAEKNQ